MTWFRISGQLFGGTELTVSICQPIHRIVRDPLIHQLRYVDIFDRKHKVHRESKYFSKEISHKIMIDIVDWMDDPERNIVDIDFIVARQISKHNIKEQANGTGNPVH